MKKGLVLVKSLGLILLAGCQPANVVPTLQPTQPPAPTAAPSSTDAAPPATATSSAAGEVEPVNVPVFCTLIGTAVETRVPHGTPINLTWGWEAKTEAQVEDYLQNNDTIITLDGKTMQGTQVQGIQHNEKSGNPEVVWYADVGALDPGAHTVTYDVKWGKLIEDGTSTYGPGGAHESLHDECRIIVDAAAGAAPLPGLEVIPLAELGKSMPWLPVQADTRPSTYYFYFDLSQPPFDNVLVRQAFAAAIDRQVLVAIAREHGVQDPRPATSFTPSETLGRDLYNEVGIPFDPDRARALLVQAGYSKPDQLPAITLLVGLASDSNIPHAELGEAVQKMWQQNLGVQVTLETMEVEAFFERIATDPTQVFRTIRFAVDNDPNDFLQNFLTGAKINYGGFSDPEFDRLIEQAAKSDDPALRQRLYIQAERILCETQAAVLPVYHAAYP
jgi:hypothetical protein